MFAQLTSRTEGGVVLPVLVWRLPRPMWAASTTVCGGGIGLRRWVLNAQVPSGYDRIDVQQHTRELARDLVLAGDGVAMLTAAKVERRQNSSEAGIDVEVTVGLSTPTWAASDESTESVATAPGTINIVAFLPVRLEDGALLNAIATATEAKTQALWEAGVDATGTPSDAVSILCSPDGEPERFAGPRSPWGARLARCVHHAVLVGSRQG